ncbi:hypothetical protein LAZ67_16001089 [Cordylochernes scorpioides]|uniref:CAP-Gly domain-containing protein n=1 Tax=Cordylochernes scorpioides TaxID=51811 RepID=A0ABY6LB25_9ARAC|nr:hypothetical protein LAZ67_16001089 [Cordylochernes scorpioides]
MADINSEEDIHTDKAPLLADVCRGISVSVVSDGETLVDDFIIGDRVWLDGLHAGYIQYIGETKFGSGDWAGIVLDEPVGKNDGSVSGIRYFQCQPKRGMFARLHRLTRYPQPGATLTTPPGNPRCRSPAALRKDRVPSPTLGTLTTTTTTTTYGPRLKIGDRVIVNCSRGGTKNGYLRYLGRTEFAPGEWAGIELDDASGKNDGSVAGKRYFTCMMKHGLFCPPQRVVRVGGPHISTKVVRTSSPVPSSPEITITGSPVTQRCRTAANFCLDVQRRDGREIREMTSSLRVRLFIFEILFIMEDEILNKNFDDDSETENYSLNESSDVSTDEECDSILTTVQMSSSNCFIGKNGYKWNKNHAIIGRTRSHNIITHLPGLKGPAKPKPNCSIDIFNLFFTAAIIKQISEFTNAKIEEFRQRISDLTKSTYSNFTSEIEIRAFLGLLYLAGVYKSGHENVESLFASDGTGRDIFRSVMSVKRFLFLLLCIRFDNFKTRCKVDRLSPIRDIFQTIIEKFQSCYTPAEYLTVDEMLVGFRGKCPFKIYIPSKPNKYGIKIVILADSRTHYMYNAMVYTGKSKTPKSKELSLPTQIVLDISRPLWKSNRNITADNWFTSIELVDKLKEHGLTYLGTMRKNKPQIPPQFQPHPKRESGTSIFGFSGTKTLVSYVPKKRKSVILISSMHHDNKCDKTTGKPDIIMDYNLTKGSVDTIDQMVSNFSTSCRSRRWPLALFYALLDITALNSYIIFNYQIDKKDQKERITFIVDLGRSLIDEHLATRNLNSLPLELQTTIKKFKNNDGSSTSRGSTMPQESDTPKRCYKCPSKNAGKVKTLCSVCQLSVCKKHFLIICENCK